MRESALNRTSWDIYSPWPLSSCRPFLRQQQYDRIKPQPSASCALACRPYRYANFPRQCIALLATPDMQPVEWHAGLA